MSVLLVLQIIIVVCMIAVILLQKSSADGFTGASSSSSFMSGRAAGNLLTRITAILATAFIVNSLVLAYLSSHADKGGSLVGGSGPVKPGAETVQGEAPAATPEAAPEPALPDALPEELPAGAKDVAPAKPAPEVPVEQ